MNPSIAMRGTSRLQNLHKSTISNSTPSRQTRIAIPKSQKEVIINFIRSGKRPEIRLMMAFFGDGDEALMEGECKKVLASVGAFSSRQGDTSTFW